MKERTLPGIEDYLPELSEEEKKSKFFKDLQRFMTLDEQSELVESGMDPVRYARLIRKYAKKYGLELPKGLKLKRARRKRKEVPGTAIVPTELIQFEEIIRSGGPYSSLLKEREFDREIRKDIIAFKKQTGDILEEFRFDKESIYGEEGEILYPNPEGLKNSARAFFTMVLDKKESSFDFSMTENLLAYGYPEEEIHKLGGSIKRRIKQSNIQLAEMRYKKFKVKPDGNKKLLFIINSPIAFLKIPDERGKLYSVGMNVEYLKAYLTDDWKLKPGTFKRVLSPVNPYRGKPIEEKAFEWLIANVKGRNLKIKAETILKDKLSTPDHKFKRKEYCLERICRWLKVARESEFLFRINPKDSGTQKYIDLLERHDLDRIKTTLKDALGTKKITDPDFLGDCRKWEIEFFSPIQKKAEISETEGHLAERIITWLYYDNEFDLANPEEKSRGYLHFYIKKLGEEKVREIFEEIKLSDEEFIEKEGKKINKATMLFNRLKWEKEQK